MYPINREQDHLFLQFLSIVAALMLSVGLVLLLRTLDPQSRRALAFGTLGISAFIVWGVVLRRLSLWIDERRRGD